MNLWFILKAGNHEQRNWCNFLKLLQSSIVVSHKHPSTKVNFPSKYHIQREISRHVSDNYWYIIHPNSILKWVLSFACQLLPSAKCWIEHLLFIFCFCFVVSIKQALLGCFNDGYFLFTTHVHDAVLLIYSRTNNSTKLVLHFHSNFRLLLLSQHSHEVFYRISTKSRLQSFHFQSTIHN